MHHPRGGGWVKIRTASTQPLEPALISASHSPLRIAQLRQRLADLGCKPCHEDRLLRGWSQVGCAVGCVFCMSGRGGLLRQLGSAEIVAQVALARRRRAVSKVVFMGMGEPAHNLDNVMEAIEVLGTQGNIGHKNLVLSTVGDLRVFERLPTETVKPALAISLHSTDDTLRARLLPNAPRIPVEELVERAEAYAHATHYPTQYQWTLIEGVNDGDAELERVVELLAGKYAIMNFIPFNAVDGLDFRRPSPERLARIVGTLKQRGIITQLRDSAGQEIEGACGQLRARAEKTKRATARPASPIHLAAQSKR